VKTRASSSKPTSLLLECGRIAPHCWLFILLNLVYFLPVLVVALFDYSEGGVSDAADLNLRLAGKLAAVYVLGTLAFLLGSKLSTPASVTVRRRIIPRSLKLFNLNEPFWVVCGVLVVLLMLTKWLLVPTGVYSEYAFDTGSMTSSLWTFSMFCSESVLFLSIVILFSNFRRNIWWFLLLTAANGINLLHGTRIFFMIAGLAFWFYLYIRGKLTFRLSIVGFVSALAVGYVVFLFRSNVDLDNQTSSTWLRVISPIMFESVFSQLSLIELIKHPGLWGVWGSATNFFLDASYFLTPRFLLPTKDQLLFIDRFSDLSPLGAFSGYAQGLIYFGYLSAAFYFFLGVTAGRLLSRASSSELWSAIYVYFTCDFLFRIMRDGYIIPIKMLINSLGILLFILCFRNWRAWVALPPRQQVRTSFDTGISR
jgi:hypothetical protein